MKSAIIIILTATIAVFCFGQKKKAALPKSVLAEYDLSDKHAKNFVLPKRVSEASGLVMSGDGRLFCHDDERGIIYQIDYTNGTIIKQFSLGTYGIKGDFEDIAMKGKRFFLMESNGTIYEFPEGDDGGRVKFISYSTFLSKANDVEGLCYDDATDCLLLLCKGYPGKGYRGYKAVYSFSLAKKKLSPTPRFLIPLDEVTKTSDQHQFHPSAITKNPFSKTFFVIAAHGFSIIELSDDGIILAQQSINKKVNPHPEGIAFAPDRSLILCNDGQGERGSISVYPPIK